MYSEDIRKSTLALDKVEQYARLSAWDTVFYDAGNPAFIPRIGQILR